MWIPTLSSNFLLSVKVRICLWLCWRTVSTLLVSGSNLSPTHFFSQCNHVMLSKRSKAHTLTLSLSHAHTHTHTHTRTRTVYPLILLYDWSCPNFFINFPFFHPSTSLTASDRRRIQLKSVDSLQDHVRNQDWIFWPKSYRAIRTYMSTAKSCLCVWGWSFIFFLERDRRLEYLPLHFMLVCL